MARQTFIIEWDAHEYEHKERSEDWFWAVGIITVAVAVASIVLGNYIFAVLVLLSAFSLALFINRLPDHVHIVVDEEGVSKENVKYLYSTLRSFWIDTDHPHKKIILRSKKMFMPLIIVPLGENIDWERLEKTLLRFLPAEYHKLPFAEVVLEYLGF
ncbi:MAG: hypothetical protein V4465_00470 [Patescibacteria group bacterium]